MHPSFAAILIGKKFISRFFVVIDKSCCSGGKAASVRSDTLVGERKGSEYRNKGVGAEGFEERGESGAHKTAPFIRGADDDAVENKHVATSRKVLESPVPGYDTRHVEEIFGVAVADVVKGIFVVTVAAQD